MSFLVRQASPCPNSGQHERIPYNSYDAAPVLFVLLPLRAIPSNGLLVPLVPCSEMIVDQTVSETA